MRLRIPKPPYEDGVAEQIEKWKAGSRLETPEIFEAFHIHPSLASRTGALGAGFLAHNLMPTRDREIVIDRVTGKHGAEHEWSLHASIFGEAVGLTEAQLDSTVTGPESAAELWSSDDLRLMEVVDELAESADLGDEAWDFLRRRYDDKQILEFVVLVGWYRTVSSMCNVLQIPPHPQCRHFPTDES
ncbi:MAG: carboxymuconolactone decarboxylase family protein [Actinomycetota bacterium]|nr:carboxymuconolactone decarboxylase family protein [Actinomycetota bacterium]